MKRSELISSVAKTFPSFSRGILSLSVRGKIPPIHDHWLARDIASDLFAEQGFPMRDCPYRLYIPRQLHSIYLGYFDFLHHEPLTSRVFRSLLKPGSVVIDVGANIGHFTLLASAGVGPQGRVHAIECSPQTLDILQENIKRNRLQNVEIHPVAAASSRGTLDLHVTAIGLSWFDPPSRWPSVEGSGTTVTVPAVPIDDLVSSEVDVIKIDAEGVDLDVLKGMTAILSRSKNVSIIVEWAPRMLSDAGQDPFELPRWLKEMGFSNVAVLDDSVARQRTLEDTLNLVRDGKLKESWSCDLFARRTPLLA